MRWKLGPAVLFCFRRKAIYGSLVASLPRRSDSINLVDPKLRVESQWELLVACVPAASELSWVYIMWRTLQQDFEVVINRRVCATYRAPWPMDLRESLVLLLTGLPAPWSCRESRFLARLQTPMEAFEPPWSSIRGKA